MKLPKTIKIAGGRAFFDSQTILINTRGRTEEAIAETLLHEVMHILLKNLGHDKIALKNSDNVSEGVAESMAVGLFQVLHDNKLVF